MTTGGMLYLLMSIAMFAAFSVVLAYQSWQQSRVGPETIWQPAEHQDQHHTVTA